MKFLTRTIWVLSLVSLFTDTASEMLYPIMPIYLKSIGFSVVLIGILEGIAEATAGLSKGYFGELSDRSGRRAPFVQWGYAISALSKPMMALFTQPLWVFFARTADRFGKGIRTGPRDAILSDEATPATKGRVFGFHRAMDTFGAVLGPTAALIYLYFNPGQYKTLFLIAFIPGLMALAASLLLKETRRAPSGGKVSFFSSLSYWNRSGPIYKKLVAGLLFFALFNSSDAFLIMRIKQSGMDDTAVIGLYIFYNLIYALLAFPAGIIADKIGLRKMFLIGLILFCITYAGMAFQNSVVVYGLLFFSYGAYAAGTEGISKAWISNVCKPGETATAIGFYAGLQSICMMLASALAGLIWFYLGVAYVFFLSASVAGCVIIYFMINGSFFAAKEVS
jgi:MFS family permease